MILEDNPNYAKTGCNKGWLPFHYACEAWNVNTAKFLFRLFPEAIKVKTNDGLYPIHLVLRFSFYHSADALELARFIVEHYKDAVSAQMPDGSLPLHTASANLKRNLKLIKLLFNEYPEAIRARNDMFHTPVECIVQSNGFGGDSVETVASFFEKQLDFERQAREVTVQDSTTGELPIHRALKSRDSTSGTFKLMLSANPRSSRAQDTKGMIPLHLAVQKRHLNIIKCLIEADVDTLRFVDYNGDTSLHHACRRGDCDIINYILGKSVCDSVLRNNAGKMPMQLLIEAKNCDKKTTMYAEAMWRLLMANPAMLV